ncbi:MAG: mechanosensitive ion channel family protein [Candidatus Riflebacteria bacterium]|nr:mechanosensitive ion channel family protein [Candidatus Riflebacteria bacterium]
MDKSKRLLAVTQRDALLAARDAVGEQIRHFELLLRYVKEVTHLSEMEHELASSPAVLAGDRDVLSQLETLTGELDRERAMAAKKAELLAANRRLLDQSVREADDKRHTAADGVSAADQKEEQRLKRRQLASIEEGASAVASQVATLDDLSQRVSGVRERLIAAQETERERTLFARRVLRFEHGFPGSLLKNLSALPGAAVFRLSEGAIALDASTAEMMIVGLVASLLMGFVLRRFKPRTVSDASATGAVDGSDLLVEYHAPAHFFARLATDLVTWLHAEAIVLSLFLTSLVLATAMPVTAELFAIPILYLGGRLVFTLSRTLCEVVAAPPEILEAWLALLRPALLLLPPILVLHEIGMHPEIVFLLEWVLKLALLLALWRLLPLHDTVVKVLRDRLHIPPEWRELSLFTGLYRLFSLLMIALLITSLMGYDNLTIWAGAHAVLFFLLLTAMCLARPLADRFSDILCAPNESARRILPISDHRAQFFYFLGRKGLRLFIVLGVLIILLHRFGLSTETPIVNSIAGWFGANGEWIYSRVIRIILILAGVALVLEFTNTLGESIITYVRNEDRSSQSENEKRASTLVQILNTTIRVVTSCIAGIMILREMGMDITPLLTGAGIVGVAVGFGSQSLVKDFFAGFFILVENQFRVGDVIEIGHKSGVVEKINLKTTVLRGTDGSVHIIPNGEINSVRNMTYAWSRAVLDIGIAYDADVDKALSLMQKIGDELAGSAALRDHIIERPEVLGVESLGDSAVTLRMLVKTRPLSQWNVARAFRKKILEVFARENIEIPFPHHVVTVKSDEGLAGLKR